MKDITNNRSFELYSLLSETNERYVAEALDDDFAEEIRAKNRRRKITMRSALSACAAVVVLVIGVSAMQMQNGGIEKDSAELTVTDEAIARENSEEAAQGISADAPSGGDGAAAGDRKTADADGQQDNIGTVKDKSDNGIKNDDITEETHNDDAVMPSDGIAAAAEDAETADVKPTFTADDGTTYRIEGQSSAVHKGKFAGTASGEGIVLYGFDNFPTRAIALAESDGNFEIVVNENYTSDTFMGMFRDFGFRHYLHSDRVGVVGQEIKSYSDLDFQSDVWGMLFADPDSCKAVDMAELPQSAKINAVTFYLHLGDDNETYCNIEISLNKEGYMYVSTGDGSLLCFTNDSAAAITDMFGA